MESDDKELYPAVKQAVQQILMRPIMNMQMLEYDRLGQAIPKAQHDRLQLLISTLREQITEQRLVIWRIVCSIA